MGSKGRGASLGLFHNFKGENRLHIHRKLRCCLQRFGQFHGHFVVAIEPRFGALAVARRFNREQLLR